MSDTTNIMPKRGVGRPPIPFDEKVSPLRVFIKNGLIRRLESVAPSFETAHSDFAEKVIERGLDALEHDQTSDFPSDGTNLDHAVTYPMPQE